MLGEAAADGRGVDLAEAADRGRDGITGPRREGAIGFSAIRGGDIVGEHDVIFAGPGERLVLRHVAGDRMLFARGAVRAVLWGQDRRPGHYSMADVLGLTAA
jgi:4-hydroxy-tetrahydrodipicolinate reductase